MEACIPDVIRLFGTAWLCLPLLFRCFNGRWKIKLTDFIGRKRTLLTGLIIMLGAFLIFLHVKTYRAFFIPLSIMGIGSITIFTSLNTIIVECIPESRGAASSIYNSCRFLGYGLAPVATLPVYLVYGLEGIVLLCLCFVVMNIVISSRVRG
ncbi:MAG: MFS transporter [Halobacteriota archaeon]